MKLPMRLARSLALVAASSALLYGAACGSDESTEPDEEENPELADVLYQGGTNDEALEQLLAATPKDGPKAAKLASPSDGAMVPKSPIATFTWGPTASRETEGDRRSVRWWDGWGTAKGSRVTDVTGPLRELLGPMRTASAHGTPVNGTAYLLTLSTASDAKLTRVFTTATTFTPDEAGWAKITGAGSEITAVLVTAIFENNLVAADGGPFSTTPAKFTIAP